MDVNSVKTTVSSFWQTNSSLITKIVIGIVVVAILVVVGWWYAGRAVNKMAADLRAQAVIDNRPLYDNLAILRDRTQQLESQYSIQKGELNTLRNNQKGTTTIVFQNPDKKVIGNFFDNTVDGYVPSK